MIKKKVKNGGNGTIEFKNGRAIKHLKIKSFERVKRFEREVNIMHSLNGKFLNIVQILEFNLSSHNPWYSMPIYQGTLNDLLHATKGDVDRVIDLFLPLIETLDQLAKLPQAVFHRDLKPDNILLKTENESTTLMLADFGCAFLQTGEDERLTREFRTVGPMMFRPPEYQAGRVDEVTEKGDIFSLGKILWYAVNGVENEVFPYTLWHPLEYNLEMRFEGNSKVLELNLLISKMVNYNSTKRPDYQEVIRILKNIISGSHPAVKDQKLQLLVKKAEAEKELKEQIIVAKIPQISNLFRTDLQTIIEKVSVMFGSESVLLTNMQNSLKNKIAMDYIIGSIQKGLLGTLWSFRESNFSSNAYLQPSSKVRENSLESDLPFVILRIDVTNSKNILKKIRVYIFFDRNENLQIKSRNNSAVVNYSMEKIEEILVQALIHYYE